MKRIFTLLTLALTLFTMPAFATEHCHKHVCDWRCHGNNHWHHPDCNLDHCTTACQVTNVVTVYNVVTQTNFLTVTNLTTTPTMDLAITDYPVERNHTYRFTVNAFQPATECKAAHWSGWKPYGVLHATSNYTARIVLPVAAFKPTVWQLIDSTPGLTKVAIMPVPTTNSEAVTYIGMNSRLNRVPDRRP